VAEWKEKIGVSSRMMYKSLRSTLGTIGPQPLFRVLAVFLALTLLVEAEFMSAKASRPKPPQSPREVAVTFDDLPLNGPDFGIEPLKDMTAKLMAVIRNNKIPVTAFVNEIKLQKPGEVEQRTAILRMWLDAGAELGNHTYSHPDFQHVDLSTYEQDVVRGEAVISSLLKE
jgi:peptidoglycan/xylan/chitin deacetylase (PgdA/CDA1 family)